jgi:PhoH-like ATPase
MVAAVPSPQAVSAPTKAPDRSKARAKRPSGPTRLFVLDTNVLLHDPTCLFRFEEHDIFLPMIVLEELDAHKKGMTEVARNGRQTSRTLDALAEHQGADIATGLPLDATGHTEARGRLFFQTQLLTTSYPAACRKARRTTRSSGWCRRCANNMRRAKWSWSRKTSTCVSRHVRWVCTPMTTRTTRRSTMATCCTRAHLALPADFWTTHGSTIESWQQGPSTFYRFSGPVVPQLLVNQFVYFEAPGEPSLYAKVTEIRGDRRCFKTLRDFTHLKNAVWGITTRNREQNFAMNLLMDPEVDFVTLTGTAGTGKTLMALASGLTQVLDERRYTEIIVTRATVSVGEDIGFLPGTEEEKMGPWMGALDDNLEVLGKTDSAAGEWGRAATNELIRSRIKIKSMNFMRDHPSGGPLRCFADDDFGHVGLFAISLL